MIAQPGSRLRTETSGFSNKRELEALLAESPASASRRMLNNALLNDTAIVLFGAGHLGRSTAQRLRQAGIEPAAFADDTRNKQGQIVAGLPVLSPQAASEKFGGAAVFVVTIHNPAASFVHVRRRLQQLTDARIISFVALALAYPDIFLPYLAFEAPQHVLLKAADIRRAFNLLADEESRSHFVAHLRFRLHVDFDALPRCSPSDYFPADVLALDADTTFVDCGAFDGDTIRLFLARQNGQFGRIFAFEPDAANHALLSAYIAGLEETMQRRIKASHAAVGARHERRSFIASGTTGAAFKDNGKVEVNVVPLDEVIPDEPAALFVKMDVEGAEHEALNGARTLIRKRNPILAISVYHRPDDLWQLPCMIHSLSPASALFLRTLGEDGMDIVCLAVPQHFVARRDHVLSAAL